MSLVMDLTDFSLTKVLTHNNILFTDSANVLCFCIICRHSSQSHLFFNVFPLGIGIL